MCHGTVLIVLCMPEFSELYDNSFAADILSRFEDRTFWLSWGNGTVRFGRGAGGAAHGAREIVNMTTPNAHTVSAISLATSRQATGVWDIYQSLGRYHFMTCD